MNTGAMSFLGPAVPNTTAAEKVPMAENIAAELTTTRIVYCVARAERQIALAKAFATINVAATFASSINDGLKIIAQELPHFVLCDSEFPDGDANSLFDQLARHPLLKAIPIAVFALKKSKEEIARIRERPFAIAYSDEQRPELLQRVLQKLKSLSPTSPGLSPYFRSAQLLGTGTGQALNASMSLRLIGVFQGATICVSEGEVTSNLEMLGINKKIPEESYLIRACESFESSQGLTSVILNYKVSGTGRARLETLPPLSVTASKKASSDADIFLVNTPGENHGELVQLLKLHGVNAALLPLEALNDAATPDLLKRSLVIYISSLTNDITKMKWRSDLAKLPKEHQPVILIGSDSSGRRSSSSLRFLRKPFSLNEFLDIIDISRIRKTDVFQVARGFDPNKSLVLSFPLDGELLGVDEAGALIGFSRMVQKGTRLDMQSSILETIWPTPISVVVTKVAMTTDSSPYPCQARIELLNASGSSKLKTFEKLQKLIDVGGSENGVAA